MVKDLAASSCEIVLQSKREVHSRNEVCSSEVARPFEHCDSTVSFEAPLQNPADLSFEVSLPVSATRYVRIHLKNKIHQVALDSDKILQFPSPQQTYTGLPSSSSYCITCATSHHRTIG